MHIKFIKVLALLSFTVAVNAADIEQYTGTLKFEKGAYVLQQGSTQYALTGLSLTKLRHFEDQQVKIYAKSSDKSLEIYKLLRKQGEAYESVYDWDVVNNDLYQWGVVKHFRFGFVTV